MARKESLIAEAELASVFHQLLQEQGQTMANPEQEFSTEVRMTVNSRRRSLENIRRSSKSQKSAISYFKYHNIDLKLFCQKYLVDEIGQRIVVYF